VAAYLVTKGIAAGAAMLAPFLAALGVAGFAERWLPEILRENRSTLTIAIGCTGGRHRSVYIAECLAQAMRGHGQVLVRHRALARAAAADAG